MMPSRSKNKQGRDFFRKEVLSIFKVNCWPQHTQRHCLGCVEG